MKHILTLSRPEKSPDDHLYTVWILDNGQKALRCEGPTPTKATQAGRDKLAVIGFNMSRGRAK